MPASVRPLLLLAAGALAVTACGGSSSAARPAPDLLAGKNAVQVASLASASLQQRSFRLRESTHASVDASGLRGPQAQVIGGALTHSLATLGDTTATGQAETAKRVSLVARTSSGATWYTVLYDGSIYLSLDGRAYATSGEFAGIVENIDVTSGDIRTLADPAQIRDLGTTTIAGATVRHLHVTADQSFLTRLLSRLGGAAAAPQAQQFLQLLPQVAHIDRGSIDEYVNPDGTVARQLVDATVTIDFGRLVAVIEQQTGQSPPAGIAVFSGTVTYSTRQQVDYSDYGAHITVRRPTVGAGSPSVDQVLRRLLGSQVHTAP